MSKLSDSRVTTTIKGSGDSTEELSGKSSSEMEMGMVSTLSREGSWEQQTTNGGRGNARGLPSRWDSSALKDHIHMSRTVEIKEEHIKNTALQSPKPVIHSPRDIDQPRAFDWDFRPGQGPSRTLSTRF